MGDFPVTILDDSVENADWIKRLRFDVPQIRSEEELRNLLSVLGITWEKFKRLPAYQGWLRRKKLLDR